MNHHSPIFASLLVIATTFSLGACGSGKEQTQPPAPPPQPVETPLSFNTSTDTIATSHRGDGATGESLDAHRGIRFMVQIGAFQDPVNASAVQGLARDRYHIPVLNDYHPVLKLYQVRIGFFEDYESARTFRTQLIQEHPKDYADAWIVQLPR